MHVHMGREKKEERNEGTKGERKEEDLKLGAGMLGRVWGRVEGRNGDRCDHSSPYMCRIIWTLVLSSSHRKNLACVITLPPFQAHSICTLSNQVSRASLSTGHHLPPAPLPDSPAQQVSTCAPAGTSSSCLKCLHLCRLHWLYLLLPAIVPLKSQGIFLRPLLYLHSLGHLNTPCL